MKMHVIGCSGGKHISQKIAKKLGVKEHSKLKVEEFPDGELHLRFDDKAKIKNREVLLVQSFYGNPNDKIVETLFAAQSAKKRGAKQVKLLALYFPYFRQDKEFEKGEIVSIDILSKMFKFFDRIYAVEPHLHRIDYIQDVMENGKKIDLSPILADQIKKWKLDNPIFIGPDDESYQWARSVAEKLGAKSTILSKKRKGDRDVKVELKNSIILEDSPVVIIDDIVSTGKTMLETVKKIGKREPSQIYIIAIHGIFADPKTLKELEKHAKVISTNTIPSERSKIDISDIAKMEH
ncbi:MAG: ribose-phosphate diphosphokinase [Candidatus Pacearchaeota archaeon]